MLPQARDALLLLPERDGLVFRSKTGRRMSQPTMSGYWAQMLARSGLDFDFYLATKHYGVHHHEDPARAAEPRHRRAGRLVRGRRRGHGPHLRAYVDGRARPDQAGR